MNELVLRQLPPARPLEQWRSVAVELLGTQTRIVAGEKWTHRVIECGAEGEPLILIHGIGGHAETYCRNLHNLARLGFHVYAIDALYHGYSAKHPQVDGFSERTAMQADAVADLIRGLGHERAHVAGESMGAAITWEFGVRHPDLVGKLVLNTGFPNVLTKRTDFEDRPGGGPAFMKLSQDSVASTSFETVRARMEWLVARPERMTDEMVDIRLRLYAVPEILDSMRYVYQVGRPWQLPDAITEEQVGQFRHETLVFWTEHNPGRGLDYGAYLAGLLPHGTFYGMRDAGHWPQWEKPEEHDQVLAEFLLG